MTEFSAARESEAKEFFAGAQRRALRVGIVLGVVATAFSFVRWGSHVGGALAIGCIVGGLNTYWLARSTRGFAAKAVEFADPSMAAQRPGSARILFLYALRYLLVAIAAYAIFKSTLFSILGFFAGLFLPVASLMFEAFYEAWVSYRRGL